MGSRVSTLDFHSIAGLGSREEALAEARWLQQSVEYRKDAYTYLGYDLALILVHAGEVEAALTEIERMLTEPCYMSIHQLKLDPLWDPIRDHPEFKTLLAKYGD